MRLSIGIDPRIRWVRDDTGDGPGEALWHIALQPEHLADAAAEPYNVEALNNVLGLQSIRHDGGTNNWWIPSRDVIGDQDLPELPELEDPLQGLRAASAPRHEDPFPSGRRFVRRAGLPRAGKAKGNQLQPNAKPTQQAKEEDVEPIQPGVATPGVAACSVGESCPNREPEPRPGPDRAPGSGETVMEG